MEFVIGGLAATTAGVLTNPIEVVKHQMEISKKCQFNHEYQHFLHRGFKAAKQEGFKSLGKGLSPALGAHLTCYGLKLGTYQVGVNQGFTKDSNGRTIVLNSISASTVGGILGQFLSNPFYLLKAEHHSDEKKRSYSDTAKNIYKEHGIRGFFRGATTSLPRALIGTSQLTSYAVAKETLNTFELFAKNPFFETVIAGLVAGLVLSVTMTPFETVISSMYQQAIAARAPEKYSGYLDCVKKIYKNNGLKPFYKGMGLIYLKLGPHTALLLVFWEELKGVYDNYEKNENTVFDKFGFQFSDVQQEDDQTVLLYL
ncbi:hypothetical protein ABEB36_012122 [Hypothenemus hampei]|uniref:Uncharacterized protein n=1 Tax=Hypothenemus hampei TaxID=57062 RepID=A0ABD1EAE6_HYPHA